MAGEGSRGAVESWTRQLVLWSVFRGLTWILDDGASGGKLLKWCLGFPSLWEDENVPIHVPHLCGWRGQSSV